MSFTICIVDPIYVTNMDEPRSARSKDIGHMIEDPRTKMVRHIIIYLVLTAGAVVMMVPLLWTVSTSLKTRDKITIRQLELIPDPVAWDNYP